MSPKSLSPTEKALLSKSPQPQGTRTAPRLESQPLEGQPPLLAKASTPSRSVSKPQSPEIPDNPRRLASPFSSTSPAKRLSPIVVDGGTMEKTMDRPRPPSLAPDTRLTQLSPQGHAAALKRALGKIRDAKRERDIALQLCSTM